MGVEGVRSVGHVTITQEIDYHPAGQVNHWMYQLIDMLMMKP